MTDEEKQGAQREGLAAMAALVVQAMFDNISDPVARAAIKNRAVAGKYPHMEDFIREAMRAERDWGQGRVGWHISLN